MKIQDKIDATELDMNEAQVRAFILGVLCAETPLSFSKMLDEILSITPEAKIALEPTFKELWNKLQEDQKRALQELFSEETNTLKFLEIAKDQLDFFLTGMSISGTHFENCKNKNLANLINELEDFLEDLEDFLSDEDAHEDEGVELKEFLLNIWADFIKTK
jgi:hypothetical protein